MRLFRLLLLLIALLPTTGMAQHFRAVVPYVEQNGKFMIDVTVNGTRGRFLLDTGAPCCVSYSFAQRAGLTLGEAQTGQDSNGRPVTARMARFDSLRVGSVDFRNVAAMCWPEGSPTERFGIDGILGYNLMQMGIVKLSRATRTFVFTTLTDSLGLDFSRATPLLPDPYVPLIEVRLDKAVVDTVMFDLGAHALYEPSVRNYARLSKAGSAFRTQASAMGALSMGASGIEPPTLKHRVKVPHFKVAGFDFRNVAAVTTGGHDSRIGARLLEYGDVVIDFRRRTFYFLPHDRKTTADVYLSDWEVIPTATLDGKIVAGVVWNKKLPIQQGDRIVALNGQRFDTIDLATATTRGLLSLPGNKATVTFVNARTGQEETTTMRRY